MKNDRFLLGILIGIGVLVALAVGLYFLRNDQPSYRSEETPDAVVHNYVTAIQLGDFERAYTYLADRENKPGFDAFRQTFFNQMNPDGTSLQIGATYYFNKVEANVEIYILQPNSGLFGETYRNQDSASLTLQEGEWKLISGPYPYWGWDWYQPAVKTP